LENGNLLPGIPDPFDWLNGSLFENLTISEYFWNPIQDISVPFYLRFESFCLNGSRPQVSTSSKPDSLALKLKVKNTEQARI